MTASLSRGFVILALFVARTYVDQFHISALAQKIQLGLVKDRSDEID